MYQWVKNVSFSENFAYVLDEWSPYKEVYLTPFPATGLILYTLEKSENCYIKKMFICENVKWGCNCFSTFIRKLFPENISEKKRGKPTTASAKIKVFFLFSLALFVGILWVDLLVFLSLLLGFCFLRLFGFVHLKSFLWKRDSTLYLGLKIKLFRKYSQTALYHQVSLRRCQCDFRILKRKTGLVATQFYIMEFANFLRNPFQVIFPLLYPFLIFSGGIEKEHCPEIGWRSSANFFSRKQNI